MIFLGFFSFRGELYTQDPDEGAGWPAGTGSKVSKISTQV